MTIIKIIIFVLSLFIVIVILYALFNISHYGSTTFNKVNNGKPWSTMVIVVKG